MVYYDGKCYACALRESMQEGRHGSYFAVTLHDRN
jgi:hypothetical protein